MQKVPGIQKIDFYLIFSINMNIIICDDADNAALLLKKIIVFSVPNTSIKIFNNGADVLSFIRTGKVPDLCFLDIIMPGMDGISLAENMRKEGYYGPIVFLTTSNVYAVESYKVKAYSYLLKPPNEKEVEFLLQKLAEELKTADTGSIQIKTKSLSKYILFKEISHMEVVKHKVHFQLINGEEIIITAVFLEIIPKLLGDKRFAQCHRSFVVNMDDISHIQGNTVIMNCGKKIPISKKYADFKKLYINRDF